ncbi:MAG: NAD+ synthase [Solirubrobacterales bacterium]
MTSPETIKIALAQINPTVGDLEGNSRKIVNWIAGAREAGAALVLLPELCLPGYPAEDLYLKPNFLAANRRALEQIAGSVEGIEALVGFAEPRETQGPNSPPAYNALALLASGRVRAIYRKINLPNYGVFDERRYFEPGADPTTTEVADATVGLTVCEDIWIPGEPETAEVEAGARLILNASASPYHRGKGAEREAMIAERARTCGVPIALCNTVGAQDELVFDGHSFVVDERGTTIARGPQFEESLVIADVPLASTGGRTSTGIQTSAGIRKRLPGESPGRGDAEDSPGQGPIAETLPPVAEIYAALCLGVRDYVDKNGFNRAEIALSGGIDSALVAQIATDALGAERVTCVSMPSPNSSAETRADARTIASNLGSELIELGIEDLMAAYERVLADPFVGTEPGLAEENLQARIRGNLVMALSNRFGWLVLTTGNKSELAVGYATLYGDMAGGFAVLKDVPKTLVYELVRYRNAEAGREVVPASVLERPPSAELRPDQRDTDSLPPYEVLDRILEAYVERDQSPEQIAAGGLPIGTVREVIQMVDRAEYKRRQAPPGIKITTRAFGRDRRLPITNLFRD